MNIVALLLFKVPQPGIEYLDIVGYLNPEDKLQPPEPVLCCVRL